MFEANLTPFLSYFLYCTLVFRLMMWKWWALLWKCCVENSIYSYFRTVFLSLGENSGEHMRRKVFDGIFQPPHVAATLARRDPVKPYETLPEWASCLQRELICTAFRSEWCANQTHTFGRWSKPYKPCVEFVECTDQRRPKYVCCTTIAKQLVIVAQFAIIQIPCRQVLLSLLFFLSTLSAQLGRPRLELIARFLRHFDEYAFNSLRCNSRIIRLAICL